jgi:hypothetical protein
MLYYKKEMTNNQLTPEQISWYNKKAIIAETNHFIEKISKKNLSEAVFTSVTAGPYTGPVELGLKKWNHEVAPFKIHVDHNHNKHAKKSTLKNNVSKVVGMWEKNPKGGFNKGNHDANGKKEKEVEILKKLKTVLKDYTKKKKSVNEDLAVWFGTKKKPKGSKQPKGPWVNICRKKEGGGHPPCGRPEATSKGYPKCRAAGVAAKMTDSQKKSACAQKRRAEKTNPKIGTGNKPKMVSYKPKKKNESLERVIRNIVKESI